MEKLSLPAAYAPLTQQEQEAVSGGGELSSAVKDFFSNFHFDGFSLGNAFVAISFTFVPFLLFNLIRTGYRFTKNVSDNVNAVSSLGADASAHFAQAVAERKPPAPSV